MKNIAITVFALACAFSAFGQTANFAAAGLSYNPGATPAIGGTGLYAHLLTGGTYAFTAVDALPTATKPFTVDTAVGVGVAQKLATLGKLEVFAPTSAGISWAGKNTGWAWTGGVLGLLPVGVGTKRVGFAARFLKSSVPNTVPGSGYQVMVTALFGWGW